MHFLLQNGPLKTSLSQFMMAENKSFYYGSFFKIMKEKSLLCG
jgi:hypothetical protein